MDVNEAVNRAIDRANVIQACPDVPGAEIDDEARELAQAFLDLHESLSNGGFLPEVWELTKTRLDRINAAEEERDAAKAELEGVIAILREYLDGVVPTLKRELEETRQTYQKRIENGMAAHNEDRKARDWLAREKERLENVIRTGGAMYRLERATMGIPGGIDPDESPHPEDLRTLAEEVLANKTRSHVGAAATFARYVLGK